MSISGTFTVKGDKYEDTNIEMLLVHPSSTGLYVDKSLPRHVGCEQHLYSAYSNVSPTAQTNGGLVGQSSQWCHWWGLLSFIGASLYRLSGAEPPCKLSTIMINLRMMLQSPLPCFLASSGERQASGPSRAEITVMGSTRRF